MSTNTLRSTRDWIAVVLVAAVAFLLFTIGESLMAMLNGATALRPANSVLRFSLAFLVATVMFVIEKRRERPSVDAATADGLQVAVVVVLTLNLGGVTDAGAKLAARTALVLLVMPLLTVLTHVVARRLSPNAQ